MKSNERESRQIVIEGDFRTPTGFIVTVLALPSELPLMRVVATVAAVAARWQIGFVHAAAVAAFTTRLGVRSLQCETCITIMVEPDFLPLCRLMAAFALCPAPALVRVLEGVTTDAGGWRSLVDFSGMTRAARNDFVTCNEYEFCSRMVERLGLAPIVRRMAPLTVFPKLLFVRLVLLVTRHTS